MDLGEWLMLDRFRGILGPRDRDVVSLAAAFDVRRFTAGVGVQGVLRIVRTGHKRPTARRMRERCVRTVGGTRNADWLLMRHIAPSFLLTQTPPPPPSRPPRAERSTLGGVTTPSLTSTPLINLACHNPDNPTLDAGPAAISIVNAST